MTNRSSERLRERIEPAVAALGLELFDIEMVSAGAGQTLRVLIDRDGGVDLETVASATQAISPILDDEPSLSGPYTLEVSSPGLERPLRRPVHFARAKGSTVSVKFRNAEGAVERVHGVLVASDDAGCTVQLDGDVERRFSYDQLVQARTVFEWGPAPKPGKAGKSRAKVLS